MLIQKTHRDYDRHYKFTGVQSLDSQSQQLPQHLRIKLSGSQDAAEYEIYKSPKTNKSSLYSIEARIHSALRL